MKLKTIAFIALFGVGSLSIAQAEIFTYTDGNLILGFQASAGTGVSQNVFFDLGPAITFRDNGSQGVLGNINATLSSVYGNDWYTRSDVWFGVVANLNAQPNGTGFGQRPAVNGDPSRTFYISAAAATPGAGALLPQNTYTSDSLGASGTNLSGLENVLKPTYVGTGWVQNDPNPLLQGVQKQGDGAGVLDQIINSTAWANSWTAWNPVPGAAFNNFTGGIQQNFGQVGSTTYVDVQRVLSTNTGASPVGVVGGGTYEFTLAIGSDGSITAVVPSASSAFTTWIGGFNPPLTNSADRLESADPDNDEIENVLEFVLNGNPSVSSPNVLPTLNATGTDFVFSFTRRADSASEVAQVFEYSSDLVDWTTNPPVTIPTAPGTSGFATVGASTGTSPNQVQAVTITIPKGANTKLFGRLKAVK